MAHHKQRRPKHQRAGCLACKPWKDERGGGKFAFPAKAGVQRLLVGAALDVRDVVAPERVTTTFDPEWWDGQHIVAQGDGVWPKAVPCDCGLKDCTGLRLRPIEARPWITVTVAPAEPLPSMCPHARPDWRGCPHCLGLNAPSEPTWGTDAIGAPDPLLDL